MSLPSDYHNHPLGHDESRKYTQDLLEPWLQRAKERNIVDIAFTDHDRYHPGIDFCEFEKFQQRALQEGVAFRMGIELDNDPETSLIGHRWVEKNYDKLDFVLGSVHFIGDWAFDHPAYKDEFDKRNINTVYREYFQLIQQTAQNPLIDGLAHLDLIKIFGYRPTEDMTELYTETLDIIKQSGKTIELSTAGWRKPVDELYPSDQILQLIKQFDIPITVASDAHMPGHLGEGYGRLGEIVSHYGFAEVTVFHRHQSKQIAL